MCKSSHAQLCSSPRVLPKRLPTHVGCCSQIMHTCVVVAHLLYFEGAKLLWLWRGSADGVC